MTVESMIFPNFFDIVREKQEDDLMELFRYALNDLNPQLKVLVIVSFQFFTMVFN